MLRCCDLATMFHLCFLYFLSIYSPHETIKSISLQSPLSSIQSVLDSFNYSVTSLGGNVSFFPYLNTSSFQSCSHENVKILLLDTQNHNFLSSEGVEALPKDVILYFAKSSRHRPAAPFISPSPTILNLFKSHKLWTDSRFIYKQYLRLRLSIDYVPTGILKEPSDKFSRTSNKTVYLVAKCDLDTCNVYSHLTSLGFQPILLGGGESHIHDCHVCSLPTPIRRSEVLSQTLETSLLLIPYFTVSSLSLTKSDIIWLQYFLFNDALVVADTRLQYEFNVYLYRERIIFYPDLTSLTTNFISSLHRLSQSTSRHSASPLASFLRCEIFATPRTVTKVNPHATNPATEITLHGTLSSESESNILAFSNQYVPPSTFKVLAIMAGFNEGDVLQSSIMNLIEQGCHVHYLDNWSTDNTKQVLQQLQKEYSHLFTHEVFPPDDRPNTFNWEDILTKKKVLSEILPYDWIIHIDPDEIRESPWGPSITLRQALYIVDRFGYNVVNFAKLVVFHPVKGQRIFQPGDNLKESFQYFEINSFHGNNYQLKAWKTYSWTSYHNQTYTSSPQSSRPVFFDLVTYGGHAGQYIQQQPNAYVPSTEIFPLKFILRHYPFRSQAHGMKKVFDERKSRWNRRERKEYGWHIQYETIYDDHQFVRDNVKDFLSVEGNYELPKKLYETLLPCPSPVSQGG